MKSQKNRYFLGEGDYLKVLLKSNMVGHNHSAANFFRREFEWDERQGGLLDN